MSRVSSLCISFLFDKGKGVITFLWNM
jgi:hypothetical protein